MSVETADLVPALKNVAARLRIDSLRSTTEAGSGHPTTCFSAAEIVASLFFGEMRYQPRNPQHEDNDRFVLSKGHAAPILYAAWAAVGLFDRSEILTLRTFGSDLEGHPTPRLSFVDVATGSLGQGLPAAVGLALNARRIESGYRTYVLLGDGETAEGSVWEAADFSSRQKLDSLCAIVDVNALGQSQPTPLGHDLDTMAARWMAFGWHALRVDGHDIPALLGAYAEARRTTGRPTVILARTIKGKGVSFVEGKNGWHGKAFKKGDEFERALHELESQIAGDAPLPSIPAPPSRARTIEARREAAPPAYAPGDMVATREAFGAALAKAAAVDSRIVALDADVKNSTFTDKFEQAFPNRFYQAFIAEQVMVGAAMGLASRGAVPFGATFACFLTRAADFIRMAGISFLNLKLAGSHAGVSIGDDGPSQMALEDLAMFRAVPNCTVLYPCDGVSGERLTTLAASHKGMVYLRTSRPKTRVLYANDERFEIGGIKTLRESPHDAAAVIAAGVTVYEALAAADALQKDGVSIRVIDAYSIQPIDAAALLRAAGACGNRLITVEDHYVAGGLGDAVASAVADAGVAVHRLAVRDIPRSGQPEEMLDRFGISAAHIVEAVRRLPRA